MGTRAKVAMTDRYTEYGKCNSRMIILYLLVNPTIGQAVMTEPITITLNSFDELFDDPEFDPWNASARSRSGIDEIMIKLRAIPIREPVSLTIQAPGETMTEDAEARTRQAIDRYCAAQIEANEDERRAIIKEGRSDFIISLVSVLALFLVIAILVYVFELEGVPLSALVAWTGIASWAILWGPVETFIWGRVPLRRAIRYYQKLRDMELEVRGV
jgi:hypothetical protein